MTCHSHIHKNKNKQYAKYFIPMSNNIYLIGNITIILVSISDMILYGWKSVMFFN